MTNTICDVCSPLEFYVVLGSVFNAWRSTLKSELSS